MLTFRDILLRVTAIQLILVSIGAFTFFSISDQLQTRIRENELNLSFSAIEAGSLQFARHYSGHLASTQLHKLMTTSGLLSRNFLYASIDWRVSSSPE